MKKKLIVLLFISSFSFISCNNKNVTDVPKKIVVTGSAELEFIPDEIFMTFTMKEYLNRSRKKVSIESIKTEFLKLCRKAGIPDSNISVIALSGNERWDYYWYKRRKLEPDFMASVSYNLKVNSIEKFDSIINNINDKAIKNFYINKTSHSRIEEFRKQVKTEALIATKNKADYLAKSIDEEIGEAILIEEIENSNYYYNSNVVSQSAISMESTSNTPDFQKIKMRYQMKAEFLLK